MDNTLVGKLTAAGFAPNQEMAARKTLSLRERGTTYVLKLQPEMVCCSFQIDGCISTDPTNRKCDHVVAVSHNNEWGEIFVELKGGQIAHGIDQILKTLDLPVFKKTERVFRKARIVAGNRIPTNSGKSIVERTREKLRNMGCEFRVIKSLQPDIVKEADFLKK